MSCYQITFPLLMSFLIGPPKGSPCEHHFNSLNDRNGSFTSPLYPEPYPVYSYCRYIFQGTPDDRVKITFSQFDLEPGTAAGCLFDYIDIFTIDVHHMKHLEERICGEHLPKVFVSVHQKVELVFKSDYAGKHKGFLGHFEFMDERWQPFDPSAPGCGSEYITGVGGEITSPNYPQPYPTDTQCTWMIKVPYNMKIIINFLDVDLGRSVHCSDTYLSLYEGFASRTRQPDEKLCGQMRFYNKGVKEFKSKTFRVVIRFVSNEDRGLGFRLTWTAVRLPQYVELQDGSIVEKPCSGFHCKGGEYCIDTTKLLCNRLPRYCIADSLRCNGVPSCGAFDHSDEEGCVTKIALVLMAVFGPLSLVLTVAIIIIMCRRKQKNKINKKKEEKETQLQRLENSPSSKRPSVSSKGSPHSGQNGSAPHGSPRHYAGGNTLTLYDNHYTLSPGGGGLTGEEWDEYREEYRSTGRRYSTHSPHHHPRHPHTLQYVRIPPAYRIVTAGVRHLSGIKSHQATV